MIFFLGEVLRNGGWMCIGMGFADENVLQIIIGFGASVFGKALEDAVRKHELENK